MPTLPNFFFTGAPQTTHSVSGSSVKDWTTSNSWPFSLHRYS
jgi:hypothetical protein